MKTVMNTLHIASALIALVVLGSLTSIQAVSPPPDGGYPNQNTAEGEDALFNLTTGSANTAVGYQSLHSVTTSSGNTAVGNMALAGSNGANGVGSTAVGDHALAMADSAFANIAIGAYVLGINVTGSSNVGVGGLYNNIEGDFNVAVGSFALASNQSGHQNTAVGTTALQNHVTGGGNCAFGFHALNSDTNGSANVAVGDHALNRSTGSYNTALGLNTLRHNTTGSRNIAIGSNAGLNLTSGSDNIDVGNNGVAGEAGIIRIGTDGEQTATYISGIATSALGTAMAVGVTSSGQLGVIGSSERYKESITPMAEASEALLALRPVKFRYKKTLDPSTTAQFGLVAEEVARINPDLVTRDKSGNPFTVRYDAVNAMLLNEFLKEHRKVQELEANAARQQKQIEELTAIVQKVSTRLEAAKPAAHTVANN
jgi:trimeric autotransporter adhesin